MSRVSSVATIASPGTCDAVREVVGDRAEHLPEGALVCEPRRVEMPVTGGAAGRGAASAPRSGRRRRPAWLRGSSLNIVTQPVRASSSATAAGSRGWLRIQVWMIGSPGSRIATHHCTTDPSASRTRCSELR